MTELNWHHRWKLWFSEEKQNFYPSLRKNMEKNNHHFKNSLDNPWPWKAVRLAASFEPWRGPPSGWQRRGMGGEGWSRWRCWRCWRCWSKSNTSILHRFFHDVILHHFLMNPFDLTDALTCAWATWLFSSAYVESVDCMNLHGSAPAWALSPSRCRPWISCGDLSAVLTTQRVLERICGLKLQIPKYCWSNRM